MIRCLLAVLLLASPSPAPTLPPAFVPPPILMYHRVDSLEPPDRLGRELTVTPSAFAAQLQYLREQGISAISMAELEERLQRGEPLDHIVVLTFDDGYDDQYRYAVPLLRRFGDSATFYIVTGEVDRPRHVTWGEVAEMVRDRMDIAAHGVWHNDLSRMSPAQQAFEIDDSLAVLRSRLHRAVYSYAYPSGRFNPETLTLVRAADVPLAVTTDARYVLAPENRFEMTRLRVRSEWSLRDFAAALEAARMTSHIVSR